MRKPRSATYHFRSLHGRGWAKIIIREGQPFYQSHTFLGSMPLSRGDAAETIWSIRSYRARRRQEVAHA